MIRDVFISEHNCTNSDDIPHGRVLYLPCPSGYGCGLECDPGYHKHALAWDDPSCENGVWVLRTTKHDASITPLNVCVQDGQYYLYFSWVKGVDTKYVIRDHFSASLGKPRHTHDRFFCLHIFLLRFFSIFYKVFLQSKFNSLNLRL